MNRKIRFAAGGGLLLVSMLGIVSCDDVPENFGNVDVEVTLRIDAALEDTTETAVWFNCMSAEGDPIVIAAEKVADGRYLAHLPENCTSTSPFIEVSMKGITYGYSPDETRFLSGKRYEFSLVVGPDGLAPIETDSENGGWGIIEIEVTLW